MLKFALPTAAALIAATSLAYAADATGTIKSIDTAKDMMTLSDGTSYTVPSSLKLSSFKVGQKVDVTYTKSGDKMEATAVKPAA